MISSILIAEAIPFFDSLTGLIGALMTAIACWNLPVIFYIRNGGKKQNISKIEIFFLTLIFAFGIALTVIGTYGNILDIIHNWATYGPPFSCACDDIWNTCECSPDHTGMQCS